MAVHVEWIAHAALHNNPGLVFHGLNELHVTRGIKVDEGTATVVKAYAGKATRRGEEFLVVVELRGLPRGGRELPYSRAEVLLTTKLPAAPAADPLPSVAPYPHPMEEVYRHFLFHGPELHAIESIDGLTDLAVVASAFPAPPPGDWFERPTRSLLGRRADGPRRRLPVDDPLEPGAARLGVVAVLLRPLSAVSPGVPRVAGEGRHPRHTR